ncbi:MAG: UDP-glucose 4-epimerase GalE [Methylococcales bacterium]
MSQTVLVTGGAGYIGSHACVELLEAGYQVVVVDNLVNSNEESLKRVSKITGKNLHFYPIDIRDNAALTQVFSTHKIDSVIHFAGLKAVGESCAQPLRYYQNNINGTLVLIDVMTKFNVTKLVFSSSATVYGDPASVPITEDFPLSATNPYGRSKLIIEDILRDIAGADSINKSEQPWRIALLRYFNPIGAHVSGLIGENPNGLPNNLMPFIAQVASGKLPQLSVFGGDYATKDGTGVRDYIHVVDLVKGHLKALEALDDQVFQEGACLAINLGTGNGYSVLEMIDTFQQVTGVPVKYKIVARRPGDVAECYANPSFAMQSLNWQAEKNLDEMLRDTWRWQTANPDGYLIQ